MKQQVNFYTEQFKPKRELLSLENMLVVWLAGIVFIFVIYNFELNKEQVAKKSWLMTQQLATNQQQQLRSLQDSFASRGDAAVLEQTLQSMRANLEQRNFILKQLGLRAEGMGKGVAGLLESLAKITIKDLWLTDIQLSNGQLDISGKTMDVELVPKLIQQLQIIDSLEDKRFSRLEIKTDEQYEGLLNFSLQSENNQAASVKNRGSH